MQSYSDCDRALDLPFCHLNDASFNLAMYELTHGSLNYDNDSLESLIFNPIDQAGHNLSFNYLDPDINFPFNFLPSNYYGEGEVNLKISVEKSEPKFSILHINSRSLLANIDKLKSMLACLQALPTVIAVTETWLNDLTSDQVNIPGYNFHSNHRTDKSGGGTGLYLLSSLEYKIRFDCNLSDSDAIESIFAEIINSHGKNIIVGSVYRPPNQNYVSFLDNFCDILSVISINNKLCYIAGDYNLDLLRCINHSPTQEFIENLFSYMFVPLIDKPTRITAHSATLIDNIFTNNLSDKALNCILINDLSDHLPILSYSFDDSVTLKTQSHKPVRNYSEANVNRFRTCLSEINWSVLLSDQDPNVAYNKFHSKYSSLYEECFPWKKRCQKQKNILFSPWITSSLLVSIKKRKKLYKRMLNSPNHARQSQYKIYSNKLNTLIRIAKRNYYDERFGLVKNNLKETWKLINEVINKSKGKPSLPNIFNHGNKA